MAVETEATIEERTQAFRDHVTSGGKVEMTDWMPD